MARANLEYEKVVRERAELRAVLEDVELWLHDALPETAGDELLVKVRDILDRTKLR